MRIYVAHASSFNYQEELYEPLLSSSLAKKHELILPHRDETKGHNSAEIIPTCDLIIAEVSYPSTGMGIELGRGEAARVPILAVAQREVKVSSAIGFVTQTIEFYTNPRELIDKLTTYIDHFHKD